MNGMTEKQRYQREYYQRNKDQICAKKRTQYQPKSNAANSTKAKAKPQRKTPKASPRITAPARATSPFIAVDKMPVTTRSRIDDIKLAKELGISVAELQGVSA